MIPRWIGLWFAVVSLPVIAGDQQRELDYAASLQRNAMGQVVWLQAGGQSFLSLSIEAEKSDNSNTAIILHDMGDHPDQQPLIHELRTVLPKHNWMTLALQLPLREMGAGEADYYPLFDEARARIDAAIDYVRRGGAKNIVLIGHGLGAAIAAYRVSAKADDVDAVVTISLALPESPLPQVQIGDFIKRIALPFLDIYAEFDLPAVVDTARQRRMIAKDNPIFRQLQIDGENHAYRYDPGLVVKRVYSWLSPKT